MLSAAALITAEPSILYPAVFGGGAVLGSFLTVVVARLPVMMMNEAEADARAFLGGEGDAAVAVSEQAERFDLAWPGSHCPACRHALRWYENLPVLSFVFQRGRCRSCKTRIPLRYPLLELAAGVLALAAIAILGPTVQGLAVAALLLALLAISAIDLEHQIVPDAIILPALWAGLGLNAFGLFVPAQSAILGAIAGFGTLWTILSVYRLITGREAIGRGDLKLAAMIGAWIGIGLLPGMFAAAFGLGALVGLGLMLRGQARFETAVPFGPFLALAAAFALLAPERLEILGGLFLP